MSENLPRPIANLTVAANLLPQDYPAELRRISAGELRDVVRRNPMLPVSFAPPDYMGLTPAQTEEWLQRLFWGDRRVSLSSEDRLLCWLENVVGSLACADGHLEQLDEEAAFELLSVSAALERAGPAHAEASRAAAHLRALLQADRFGYAAEQIESRLRQILGDPGD